jgi:hypothetical protein
MSLVLPLKLQWHVGIINVPGHISVLLALDQFSVKTGYKSVLCHFQSFITFIVVVFSLFLNSCRVDNMAGREIGLDLFI